MILAILQARTSSSRMPGKVLAPLLGEPMIIRQLARLSQCRRVDRLVVATSSDDTDDVLVETLERANIEVRRGPLNDVVRRFESVVREFNPKSIVRLTADCPLADPEVIDRVINAHLESDADYTSNTLKPTFPDGLDVECISSAAFQKLLRLELTKREREHVTLGIYSRPAEFTLNSVTQTPDRSNLRWTVDLPDDLKFVEEVYDRLYREGDVFGQEAIVRLLADHPELVRTDEDMARNAGLQ